LPQPEGPKIIKKSPVLTSKEISFKIGTSWTPTLNDLEKSLSVSEVTVEGADYYSR